MLAPAAREARDVGGIYAKRPQHPGGVIGHRLHRSRTLRHRRSPRTSIVEPGQPVAVREPVELELPRLDGVAELPIKRTSGPWPTCSVQMSRSPARTC
jgi:hypothetical protein